jgi:hypothetical protein
MSPESKSPCKRVHFFGQVLVRPSLSSNEYTKEESKACWYTNDERKRIRQEISETVHSMTVQDSDSGICMRGLEHHTRHGSKSRRRNRRVAYNAVFDEQDRQFDANVWDDESIAMAYSKLTISSKLQAYVVGLQDQKEFQKSCREDVNKSASEPCLLRNSSSLSRLVCHHHRIANHTPWSVHKSTSLYSLQGNWRRKRFAILE